MTEFTPCPECKRSDFKSRSARDVHVYRCKRKSAPESTIQKTLVRSIDEEDIIDRFLHGELGEQDAVNEYERQWELANPQPKDGYREWSAKRAKEVDAFRERLIRSKPRVSQSQTQSVFQSQIPHQLSITEIAERRAMELRGEILPSQLQAFQAPIFEPEQPVQPQLQQTNQLQPARKFTFNLSEFLNNLASRIFLQKKQEFPDNSYNEWGQPMYHYKCLTCGAWISANDVAIHQAQAHIVKYTG